MAILVVDDSSSIRTIIKNSLIKMGFSEKEIIPAEDGVGALKKLNSTVTSIILH